MDMEDDITHPTEEIDSVCVSNCNHGSSSEQITNLKAAVEQDKVFVCLDISKDHNSGSKNSFQRSDSSILSKESELQVNSLTHQSSSPHEVFDQFEMSANHTSQKVSPSQLLGDYSSDDSAENREACVRPAKPERVASFSKHIETNSSDDHGPNNLSNSRKGFDDATTGFSQKEEKSTSSIAKVDEFGRLVREDDSDIDSGDSPHVTWKRSIRGRSRSWGRSPRRGRSRSRSRSLRGRRSSRSCSPHGRRSSRSSSPRGRRSSRSRSPRRKRSSRSRSPRGRRSSRSCSPRGRRSSRSHSPRRKRSSRSLSPRGRSSSRSCSPRGRRSSRSHSPHCRRRSPRRRHGRHGHSRSFSPKRHRSRSKSPSYRRGGEIGTEKMRRHKAQLPDCLDYIRGKCYRGESCRYLHRKSDKTTDRLRSSHMKHPNDVLTISKSSNVYEDINPISTKRSVQEHKEHDESQNLKQEVHSTDERRGVAEELSDGPTKLSYTETSIGAHVYLDTYTKVPSGIPNCQTQLMDGQVAAESLLQTSAPLQSQLPSSRPYLNKDSSSTSFSHLVSTNQPFAAESAMPHSYLPEVSPSVGNHSSNSLVGNSLTPINHIPRDYNLIHLHPQFAPPSTTTWNSLPPPPPFPFPFPNSSIGNTTTGPHSAQFQQNIQPPYSDLRYQVSTGVGQPVMYPQTSEPHNSLYDANRFEPRKFPVVSKPMDQIHGLSSYTHPYMHHSVGNLHPAPDGVPSYYREPGKAITTLSNCSDNPEVNQPQHFTDLGRLSSNFQAASALNEPLTAKFYSDATQRKDARYCDVYGTPYSLNHASADQVTAKGSLPAPAGDQYDPLSDSIEPSSSSVKKPDISQMLPTGDSGVLLRTSGPNQLLDVDGNNKLKGSGSVEVSLSLENYEHGETADAEVGDVEDGSASNPQSAADMVTEEDETNQVKASGKTKKGKNSKFMKFFKIAIADFVKEVLKPSWRQGNMSKEAFKTIVKKTVDKVSAATGNRHIPKTREKIDHYVDSQQRKLTKLIMGYVDKYVNA